MTLALYLWYNYIGGNKMAKVPLPERGQPLDVAYIYQITNALNQLSDQVSTATSNYTTVDTYSAGRQSVKTSDLKVVGGTVTVAPSSTVNAATTKGFSYTFSPPFKYAPIVTASPINTGKTTAGENVNVVVTDVSANGISGIVRFNASGDVTVVVNIIAIGIAN
jgi:hypothetical protein